MKPALLLLVFFSGLFSACNSSDRLERIQVQAPTDAEIVGSYAIVEETATGLSLERAGLKDTRVDIVADGTLRLSEFPIFSHPASIRGIFTKITETGCWIITSDRRGYYVGLIRENGDRLNAIVTEGGNPSDLILYYGPRENGYFTKLRKL